MSKFELYVFGGSLGEISGDKSERKFISGMGSGRLYGTYLTKEEAQRDAKSYVRSFSGGRKNYYRPRYRIVEMKEERWKEDIWGVR